MPLAASVSSSVPEILAPLLGRRSVSPRRLTAPGPGPAEIDAMLRAALRGPDHGGLHPWRVIEFGAPERLALADAFEAERHRRQPEPTELDIARAREHALQPPVLLAFVVGPLADARVPEREQWLAAGAALGNLLQAAHLLGFGASILSGERCADRLLAQGLGLGPHEVLAGFVSIGTTARAPAAAPDIPATTVWSRWRAPSAGPVTEPLPAAAILVDPGSRVDDLMACIVDELKREGRSVHGLLARPMPPIQSDADACAAPMVLVDVVSGESYTVSQALGSQSRGCRADPRGFAMASAVLRSALASTTELIVCNRFGGLESEGGGFSAELLSIMSEGIPVLTAVSPRHLADWARFTGGATVLPPRAEPVRAWIEQTLALRTAAQPQHPIGHAAG